MIHIINRHCKFSQISATKERPKWFSRKKCFQNLLSTVGDNSKIHILFDGDISGHFLENEKVTKINAGSGSKSFRLAVEYSLDNSSDEDIIYFVEDDYLHSKKFEPYLLDGLTINPNGYISLYDHPDKYTDRMYENLKVGILTGSLCHWKQTPSTTDTFAIKKRTLAKHKDTIMKYSQDALGYSLDHERCLDLWSKGVPLISPIPGISTHCEPKYLSPYTNWDLI